MKRKTIIISHDALVFDDLEYLKSKPTFNFLLENGAQIQKLRTIYPSITYPAHCSMISGCYPNKTKLINNEIHDIGHLSLPWNWFSEANKSETLFDIYKNAGLTTASVFWPVTGNNPNIDYLIDEYWSQTKDDDLVDVFRRSGSNDEVIEKVLNKNLHMLKGKERQHPFADRFVMKCAADMILEFKPDLLTVHPAGIDGFRHSYGLFGDKINESLDDTEEMTSWIIDATKKAGVFEDTDFIIMSDHGQMSINRYININVILRDNGLIEVDENENFVDYKAWCSSTGLSAQVFLKNPDDTETYNKTYNLLKNMCYEGIYGISEIFTREEINEKEHLDGTFSFVIETDGFTSFNSAWKRPLIGKFDITDYRLGHATHGHLPGKGPQPTLIAMGPSFKKGAVVQRCPIVNVAPTIAKTQNLSLENADGKIINEILL